MNIMMFNGLLLLLLFMWTSAEKGLETEHTGELQVHANEIRVDSKASKGECENLGGKCIKKKKDCPSSLLLETKPGKPYCSKKRRCCYPDNKECEVNNGGCDHICTDTIGSYVCSCQEGFTLDDDQITCIDNKECEVNNGGCDHICTDTIGSYVCSCQGGYTLDDDQITCIDTNECEVNNGGCDHICTDTVGSYICFCQEGYILDDDQITCIDVSWSGIRNACIKSNNYKTYTTSTIDLCKEKCVEEEDIICQSIEYSSEQQMCSISEARSDSVDFTEPCFVDGWVFAERELYAGTSSCNLVWNYKEERPLIMIRNSTTSVQLPIVPPIIDMDVSDDPNRIPKGEKLVLACPGKNNKFKHVKGTHTKLHGECISHDLFKVCLNNNPVKLDLRHLSCSRKMHPSFIKDNATSDKNNCDGIGGEPFKTGYTYGDNHEFKDLDIEVCFSKKNQTTLCTSSNLHGNETDYRNAIEDSRGKKPTGGKCVGCAPEKCTFKVDLDVIDDGRCKTKADGIYKTEVQYHRECILPCKCFIKGCLPRRCNGLQGTCRWTQQQSQVELPGDRVCTNGCKCYMPGCNPRDCKDSTDIDNEIPGICSKDGPQGIFKKKAIKHNCGDGCDCYTKDIYPTITSTRHCNDKNSLLQTVWGKHVCNECMMVDKLGGTMSVEDATIRAKKVADDLQPPRNTAIASIFAAGRPNHIEFEHTKVQGKNGEEDACKIKKAVQTWKCTKIDNKLSKYKCEIQGLRRATLILGNGHLVEGSLS